MSSVSTPSTGKRTVVKKHKDRITALSGSDKYAVRRLLTKLLDDYKQVASKRGTRNFSMGRWLDDNVK